MCGVLVESQIQAPGVVSCHTHLWGSSIWLSVPTTVSQKSGKIGEYIWKNNLSVYEWCIRWERLDLTKEWIAGITCKTWICAQYIHYGECSVPDRIPSYSFTMLKIWRHYPWSWQSKQSLLQLFVFNTLGSDLSSSPVFRSLLRMVPSYQGWQDGCGSMDRVKITSWNC